MRYLLCRHIKTNGVQCQSPSLADAQYCFFHARLHTRPAAFQSPIRRTHDPTGAASQLDAPSLPGHPTPPTRRPRVRPARTLRRHQRPRQRPARNPPRHRPPLRPPTRQPQLRPPPSLSLSTRGRSYRPLHARGTPSRRGRVHRVRRSNWSSAAAESPAAHPTEDISACMLSKG